MPLKSDVTGRRALPRNARRVLLYTGALATALTMLTLLLALPIIFGLLSLHLIDDWGDLGDVGQAYGAASALLSGFALMAVSASVVLQLRHNVATQQQAARGLHRDLLEMCIRDPHLYWPVMSGTTEKVSPTHVRRHIFTVLLLNYFEMSLDFGVIPEKLLREEGLTSLFAGPHGQLFWQHHREGWRTPIASTHRGRRFFDIADEEYRRARETRPFPTPAAGRPPRPRSATRAAVLATGGGISMAVLLCHAYKHRAMRSS
jgi:hypothetical protein